MSIVATIVVGIDGSSTLGGSSQQVTTSTDRERFLKRRRLADCIIIGGNTARNEPYIKTPVPLVIVSKEAHPNLPSAYVWNLDPKDALVKASKEFGENILIEGGASFITYLLEEHLIEYLELSITPIKGGEDIFDYKKFLSQAVSVDKNYVNETTFYSVKFTTQK